MRKMDYLKPDEIKSTHTMTKGLVVLKTTLVEKVVDWLTLIIIIFVAHLSFANSVCMCFSLDYVIEY